MPISTHLPNSPFEGIFSSPQQPVPIAFQQQFLLTPEMATNTVLHGSLDIWYRPRWLRPLFFFLERLGILISEAGNSIPTTLVVSAVRDPAGMPIHRWDRTFHFRKPRYFNTILAFDPSLNAVVDFIGFNDFIFLVWVAHYHPPDRFTLDTHACALQFRKHLFWLPRWLWQFLFGIVRFNQTIDPEQSDCIQIDLIIWHPWFGDCFGYQGRLTVAQSSI